MKLTIAKSAGFCFGVKNAVETAEKTLTENDGKRSVYTIGAVTHNAMVMDELVKKGLIVAEGIDGIPEGSVLLVRSHGLGEETLRLARKKNIEIIDATCVNVKKTHDVVADFYGRGYQIIIAGEDGHPEVEGIKGWCGGEGIVIASEDDAKRLASVASGIKAEKFCVVSQSTFGAAKWRGICDIIEKIPGKKVEIRETICYTTLVRQDETAKLAAECTGVLVLGSRESSNTRKLYDAAKRHCASVYFIESAADLKAVNFKENDKIGVTAGASTSAAFLAEVMGYMSNLQTELKVSKEFAEGVERSFAPPPKTGKLVTGKIIGEGPEGLRVNVGGKKDGLIPAGAYDAGALREGDEIEAVVKGTHEETGCVLLSKKEADDIRAGEEAVGGVKNGEPFDLKINEAVKGGLVGKLGNYRVFVPAGQIRDAYVNDLKGYEGKTLRVVAVREADGKISVDEAGKRIVASARKLAEEERAKTEEAFFGTARVGARVTGKVKRITDFGAFVSVNGFDCLAHVSDLSWSRSAKVSDSVKEGEEREFEVLTVDREKKRVSLGLKQLAEKPWEIAARKYPAGSVIKGKVARLVSFGAFIELEPGVDALCHVSDISPKYLSAPREVLKEGDEIDVKVVKNEPDKDGRDRRITVSIKACLPESEITTMQEEIERELSENGAERKRRVSEDKARAAEELEALPAEAKKKSQPPAATRRHSDSVKSGRFADADAGSVRQWSESAANNPFAALLKDLGAK